MRYGCQLTSDAQRGDELYPVRPFVTPSVVYGGPPAQRASGSNSWSSPGTTLLALAWRPLLFFFLFRQQSPFSHARPGGDTPDQSSVDMRMDGRIGRADFGGWRLHSRTAFKEVGEFGLPRREEARDGKGWGEGATQPWGEQHSSLIPPVSSGTPYDSTLLFTPRRDRGTEQHEFCISPQSLSVRVYVKGSQPPLPNLAGRPT